LYQFIVIVFDLYQKLKCFHFYQNILISFVVKQREVCGFSQKNFTFASVILGLSSSSPFSVQVSVLCSRAVADYLLASLLLDLGKFLGLD
jgi:hypothetical protein